MNIYVGNLSFDVKEENLQTAFQAFGQVSSATIVRDKYSGQPRGFGFVEMPDQNEARTAIANLNGKELLGRQMNVNEARPRPSRGGGPGRQGGRGGRSHEGGGAGAVTERGPCSSRLTQGSCVQSCLSHDKYRSKKVARHKEEGVGGQKAKNSISPETFSTMPVTYLALSEAKKTTARPHRRSDDMALKL